MSFLISATAPGTERSNSPGQLPQTFFGTARLGTRRDSALAGQANSIALIFYLAGRAESKKIKAPRNQIAVHDARSATWRS
jgi:hypothetical protein